MQRRSHAPGVPLEVDREEDRCRYFVLSILDLARWVTRLDRDCLEKGCGAWTGSARGADARGAERVEQSALRRGARVGGAPGVGALVNEGSSVETRTSPQLSVYAS
jgi:hypothetical protein